MLTHSTACSLLLQKCYHSGCMSKQPAHSVKQTWESTVCIAHAYRPALNMSLKAHRSRVAGIFLLRENSHGGATRRSNSTAMNKWKYPGKWQALTFQLTLFWGWWLFMRVCVPFHTIYLGLCRNWQAAAGPECLSLRQFTKQQCWPPWLLGCCVTTPAIAKQERH